MHVDAGGKLLVGGLGNITWEVVSVAIELIVVLSQQLDPRSTVLGVHEPGLAILRIAFGTVRYDIHNTSSVTKRRDLR